MRVVYLGLAVPNLSEYLTMYTELLVEFKNDGHDVLVVGPSTEDNYEGLREEAGFNVLRVPTMKLFGVGKYQKGVANILLPHQFKKTLKASNIDLNFDLVIIPTPPVTLWSLANWFKKKYKSKVYLILRDIFPQNAVDLKMMSQTGLVHSYFRKMEKNLYKTADYIGCMSQGNIDFIVKHNPTVPKAKLHLLPNWTTLLEVEKEKDIALIEKYNVQGKFVVMFGGNMGLPQRLENVVALAKECEDIPDIHFLMFGDGNASKAFRESVSKSNLTNITVNGFLSKVDFFKVLQIADVGLISLSEDFTIPNIPSKTMVYLNAKKPVLASIDKNTDYGHILEEIKAGVWAEAGKPKELKEALLTLYNNEALCKQMGENGYNYLLKNYLREHAYETVMTAVNN